MICSSPLTMEPSLIEIGDNVVISTKVTFVTHDNSVKYVHPDKTDVFGKIIVGNNCFIGENSTLLYGVRIADNVIVAAGSVVTKSVKESNVIVGGNPTRVISTWDRFKEKTKDNAIRRADLYKSLDKLIER